MKFLNKIWETITALIVAALLIFIAALVFVAVTLAMFIIFVVGSVARMVAEIERIWLYNN